MPVYDWSTHTIDGLIPKGGSLPQAWIYQRGGDGKPLRNVKSLDTDRGLLVVMAPVPSRKFGEPDSLVERMHRGSFILSWCGDAPELS